MTRVLAIDPSAEATGVALPDGTTLRWSPFRTNLTRPERLSWWARNLEATLRRTAPDLVVYEDISGGGSHFALAAQSAGGLRSLAEVECYRAAAPMVLVHPNRLKRYATGRGGADKDDMVLRAKVAGADVGDHNEADAWLLRALAIHAMDGVDLLAESQGADPGHRLEVVAAHTWPKVGR